MSVTCQPKCQMALCGDAGGGVATLVNRTSTSLGAASAMAIAAYNAGDRPVAAFRGIPPYPETREYVARVLRYYGAPLAWELQGSNIQQYVGRDGNVTYTNVAPRRFTTAALQTK